MENKLAEFCKINLNFNDKYYADTYGSLSFCILDCVYSLRAKYFSVTKPVVKRYADTFFDGNELTKIDTLTHFMENIDSVGGCEIFAVEVLKNRQKLSGRLKSEICYELARKLLLLNIETVNDFMYYPKQELIEIVVSSVKGMGEAGINYLFMLAGDSNRCKPDVHIHHCIKDACGCDVSNEECQKLMVKATKILQEEYPLLTVKKLDGLIWNKYQIGNKKKVLIDNKDI